MDGEQLHPEAAILGALWPAAAHTVFAPIGILKRLGFVSELVGNVAP